jgi:Rrf2 family protein
MLFSKTTTYAIRILIFMAGEDRKVFSAKYLYSKLGIHNRYMRRVLTQLTNMGLLRSIRGINGGFVFSRPPSAILLYEIIDATENMSSFEGCILGISDCRLTERCVMHNLWEETKQKMLSSFSATSLEQLAKGSRAENKELIQSH